MTIKVIDLFSGPGGLGEGFASLDGGKAFQISVSAEMESTAHSTLTLRAFFRLGRSNGDKKAEGAYYDFCNSPAAKHPSEVCPDLWARAKEEARQLTLGDDNGNIALESVLSSKKLDNEGILQVAGERLPITDQRGTSHGGESKFGGSFNSNSAQAHCSLTPALRRCKDPVAIDGRCLPMNPSTPVKFDDLLAAYEWVSASPDDSAAFVSRATGKVHWSSSTMELDDELPDDIEDGSLYVAVPNKHDLNLGRDLPLNFAEEHLTEAYQTVANIFRQRGAYGRFKDLLERRGLLQAWYDFQAKSIEIALREWAAEEGLSIIVGHT